MNKDILKDILTLGHMKYKTTILRADKFMKLTGYIQVDGESVWRGWNLNRRVLGGEFRIS